MKGKMKMKKVMMDTIYDEIDKAKIIKHFLKIDGMIEMFFLCVNTQGITLDDYYELFYARQRKFREIYNKKGK